MEVEPGIRVVTAPNPGLMTGDGTNQYLLGEKRLILIDAALGEGPNVESIERELTEASATIETILLTHIHRDHLGGANALANHFGATVGIHESRAGYAGVRPDLIFRDGDTIAFDMGEIHVVHTPGHESGHCCFFEPERGWLITGDHVVGEGTVVIRPPDGNMNHYIHSLRKLRSLPARRLFGGHGPVVDDPAAKIEEYIEHRLSREQDVLDCLVAGRCGVAAIVEHIYREIPRSLHSVAAMMIEAHLTKLEEDGRIVGHDGVYHLAL